MLSTYTREKKRYFIIHNIASDEGEIIRYAALLRGTESAWQAVSYGLESVTIFAEVGGVYLNFGLWAISLLPVWLLLKHFGTQKGGQVEANVSSPEDQGRGQVQDKPHSTSGEEPDLVK